MNRKIYCSGDAELMSWLPDRNMGAANEIQVGSGGDYGVVKFNLPPDLLNYDIVFAKLWLYFSQSAPATYIRVHKILEDWIEGTGTRGSSVTPPGSITYNNAPLIDTSYVEHYISSIPSGGQWREISIINDLAYPPRFGWAIKNRPNVERWWTIYTRERPGDYEAYLEISYKYKKPIMTASIERTPNGFKLTWPQQQINYARPSYYRIFKHNPVINEYVLIRPTPDSNATVDGNTFEYLDTETFDYDYNYKYAIDAIYYDSISWGYSEPCFIESGMVYKSEYAQIALAAVGGHSAMRHIIDTKHSMHLDELNKIEMSVWKKDLDATSISDDIDLYVAGDGNTFTKNILPIDDSHLGDADQRWLEIHAEELKTDTSKTAKLRLWNGR